MRKYLAIFLATLMLSAVMLAAQDADDNFFFGDDDLFGGGDMVTETPAEPSKTFSLSDIDIFNNDTVRIGGSLSSSLQTTLQWNEDDDGAYQYNSAKLVPDLRGAFFIDARPSTNLRIYNKFTYAFPFKTDMPLDKIPGLGLPSVSITEFNVFELFTDFSWNESAFFRFGKHTIKWGVGYFFSPADVLNLSVIDPEEPETQREGPVSLRAQFIFPNTQNVLYTYVLPDTNTFAAEDTAGAAKFEFPVGTAELGFGGWYKRLRSPRFTVTYSGTIAGKVSAFGEGLFAWGKDDEWLAEKATADMGPVFQVTAGLSYRNTDLHLTLMGQYFYNGFGEANGGTSSTPGTPASGTLSLTNLSGYSGQHYAAGSIGLSELFTPKLSVTLFGMFGIDTESGTANLSFSWSFFDELSISAGPTFTYGEYTRDGKSAIGLQITAQLGGGRF
ncbi:hypothetical protein FACS189461_2140 [Spirochaetia bacterium]|nr:hypothetical protein FACS189461_2140 [Spirochaetia bacterium]